MIFKSKQTVDGAPVWEVDTDTQTVRHRSPKTGKTERYMFHTCLLYTSPSPRDLSTSRMPSSA